MAARLPPAVVPYGSYRAWLEAIEGYAGQIAYAERLRAEPLRPVPYRGAFAGVLQALGLKPYAHQAEAFRALEAGEHVVLATPTASGKSLVYQVPALKTALEGKTALFVFPTKALARDQEKRLLAMEKALAFERRASFTYDGDTHSEKRKKARAQGKILLTNPDMLHYGILPRHPDWAAFLGRLSYLVVDELHYYRGVFGSHAGMIFRRLLRLARFYGANPQIVAASATIENPGEHAERLFGAGFRAIRRKGALSEREFVLWRPKALDKTGEHRRSPNIEAALLAEHAALHGVKTLVFAGARRSVELIGKYTRGSPAAEWIRTYRAGYTPGERRRLEEAFKNGEISVLVSTNALELGIDIGDLDAVILVGFPGSMMSFWQRAGRAGRSGRRALVLWIPRDDPLDAYYEDHPERLVGGEPEAAVADPFNPYLYPLHLHAAARELPLEKDEPIYRPELAGEGFLERGGRIYTTVKNPHRRIVLRGSGPTFRLKDAFGKTIGTLDERQAYWEAHPGAVFLHMGESYLVKRFDAERREIELLPSLEDYYTQPLATTEIFVDAGEEVGRGVWLGKAVLVEQVVGYVKKRYITEAVLEEVPLEMPEIRFATEAVWFHVEPEWLADERGLAFAMEALLPSGIHALEHTMIGMLPLFVLAERADIGGVSYPAYPHPLPSGGGRPTIFIYDGHPGGVGYVREGARRFAEWIAATRDRLESCPCESGCPRCILSPKCGNQNRYLDKGAALKLARALAQRHPTEPDAPRG